MSAPVDFAESNFTWKGWPASESKPEVMDLPSFKQGDQTLSCWRFGLLDRIKILLSGNVWLIVIGQQPPVSLLADSPLVKEE